MSVLSSYKFMWTKRFMRDLTQLPFHQGQLDIFCAGYSVCNALRLLGGMQSGEARRLLNRGIMEASHNPQYFQEMLDQTTDYVDWVDLMLSWQSIHVGKPFAFAPKPLLALGSRTISEGFPPEVDYNPSLPEVDEVWQTLESWIDLNQSRCAIFQFIRFLPLGKTMLRHWTCCEKVEKKTLMLYDCSNDPGALYFIEKSQMITNEAEAMPEKILIPPHSIRLLLYPDKFCKADMSSIERKIFING